MNRKWPTTIRGCVMWGGLCAALLLACAGSSRAGDWPQWGGSDCRNACSSEKGLPETFVPGEKDPQGGGIRMETTKNVKWAAPLGKSAYGNQTVANGRVFIGTDDETLSEDPRFRQPQHGGMLKCFDEATGKLLWQLPTPPRPNIPKEWHFGLQKLGVCSSPTVDGDRVYIVTPADEVLCLDVRGQANGNDGPFTDEGRYMAKAGGASVKVGPADGDILWKYNIIDELKVIPHDVASCSPLVVGDFLYVSTSNGVDHPHEHPMAPSAPAIIVLNKHTGKLVAAEQEGISARMFHTQWSSPSTGKVGDKQLVFFGGTDGYCYAFEALTAMPAHPVVMKRAWVYDCNPGEYRTRDGKPIHYMSGDKRRKTSPNKNDGTYLGPSEVIATPVFYKNRIYVAIGQDPLHGRGRGLLHCIDATAAGDISKTGCIWKYDGLDRTIGNATIDDGLVYIADVAGRLHCLDAETGKRYWVQETGYECWGTPLVADGKVYLGTKKALYVFAAGREPKLLGHVDLGTPAYNTPIAANSTLYVASQRYLWAVTGTK